MDLLEGICAGALQGSKESKKALPAPFEEFTETVCWVWVPGLESKNPNVGAFIIRTGFWGPILL